MSVRDTRWHRLRRQLGPVTRRIPYGHVVTESATYSRLYLPGLPRPDRRFVIFAQGRSGSTLLADLLNCHPDVYCADEILTWKRRDPARYAKACSVGHRGTTYGFKVKIYQLTEAQQIQDPGSFLSQLDAEGWKVIYLHRRNVLRQALSSLVAARRDVYHESVGQDGASPVVIDPRELLTWTDQRVRYGEAEGRALQGVPHHAVVYEDDLLRATSHQQTATEALRYLGLEPVAVTTSLRKIGDRPLEQVVANADEVVAAVTASPYAELLSKD